MKGSDPYWVLPLDGDPIGAIGSGFRQVWVKYDLKGQYVYIKAPGIEGRLKMPMTHWVDVAHIANTGLPWADVLHELRRFYHKGD